jgi:hypothetical protein
MISDSTLNIASVHPVAQVRTACYIHNTGRLKWSCGRRQDMSCPIKHWSRGLASHSRHGSTYAFFLFALSCVGSGLPTGWIPVSVRLIGSQLINSGWEQTRGPNPSQEEEERNTVTCTVIARQRVAKQVPAKTDSW